MMFIIKNLTFTFSFLISIFIHVFLFSIFYIESLNHLTYRVMHTKIAFIHDMSAFIEEDILYSLAEDIVDDIPELMAENVSVNLNQDEGVMNEFNVMKDKNDIKYKKQNTFQKENTKQATVQINSHRKVLRLYYPRYPVWAKRMGLESEIKISIKIDKKGFVKDIMFDQMSDHPELDIVALRAVRKWRFQPVFAEAEVEQWASAVLKFKLD